MPTTNHQPSTTNRAARILIIAGSDSGGGAGIQGDIKTVTALGGYAATAITALTAQNTLGVFGIHEVPDDFIRQQIDLVLNDIGADAIKTGMLHKASVIETIADSLNPSPPEGEGWVGGGAASAISKHSPNGATPLPDPPPQGGRENIPLILDPVMFAKGGAALLQPDAIGALKTLLIPHARIITPNIPEAEHLTGLTIRTLDDMKKAAEKLLALGPKAVLLKGGHADGPDVTDLLLEDTGTHTLLTSPRLDTPHTHGTGCTYASAIATGIAQGMPLEKAVRRAHAYVAAAIRNAPGLGKGHGPLGHFVSPLPRAGEG